MDWQIGLRRAWRVPALLWVIVGGIIAALLARVMFGTAWPARPVGCWLIMAWMRCLNAVIGLRVRAYGVPVETPSLWVVNHISWLDVPALAALAPVSFIAKKQVRKWPVLGWLAAQAGTGFLDRDSIAALQPLLQGLVMQLRAGRDCAVFPEGTSTAGDQLKPFFPALFQAAIDAGCPVQPVVLEYRRQGKRDAIAPFTNDQSFVAHLWALFAVPQLYVTVNFLEPLDTASGDRRQLALRAYSNIHAYLFADTCVVQQPTGT